MGPTATYRLPLQSVGPYTVTAVITQGLPAREYGVVVTNLNEPGGPVASPTPGVFALYYPPPPGTCFYDYFGSGAGKWERSGDWATVVLPDGDGAMTDSPPVCGST